VAPRTRSSTFSPERVASAATPEPLRNDTSLALEAGETNYPPSDGMLRLREAVRAFYRSRLGLDLPLESVLIAGGSRPVIYATYRALVEPEGRLHAFCHAVPGKWHLMGVTLAAAGSLQWYRDTLAPAEPFDALVAEASSAPAGCEGLVFLPYLSGERTPHPDPLARGAFVGRVKVDLVAGRAPNGRGDDRQAPIEISGPTQRSRCEQNSLALPERREQDRKIAILRQETDRKIWIDRDQQVVCSK